MSAVLPLRQIGELPGPVAVPLFGNAFGLDATRLHLVAEDWQRRYGDFFQMRIGPRRFLVIAEPEAIARVLRERPEGFQRTRRLSAIADELGFRGVFTANGERWRRQRPMVMASFDPAHIKSYFPALVRVTERFARRWQRAATEGRAIELQADLMRYTVDVTAGLAFGADINTLESDTETIQHHLDKVLRAMFKRAMALLPYWRWLPDFALARHRRELEHAVQSFIAAARARIEVEPQRRERPCNLIEAMIVARDDEGSGLADADVAGNVLTMLLAGEDTTAHSAAWLIYLLARNPEALARAREEVHAVLGAPRVPSDYEVLARLPYVEACIHETMRLKPVAPIIMAQAVRPSVIAGIAVPAEQLVMCLMRPANLDERNFANAARFEPGRWLDRERAAAGKRVSMPFGAGPRLCPGRYLAMLELKMLAAMLLALFDIESVATPEGGEPREHLALTMSPVGLRLRLRNLRMPP
ncbi:MAG: cytochrome P450 [Burkholderiales bacterium]